MTSTALRPDSPRTTDAELKGIAVAVVTGALAIILDTTIVSVALHALGRAFDASVDGVAWVSTAYLLAMFVAIPVAGWAQSRLGAKRLWILSLAVFLLGSVLCAAAWSLPSLVAFRVLQGLGGGVLLPLMTTILMQAAEGRSVGRLMAAVSLPAALGPILGPVLGGVLLHTLSWQWLFLVNVPLCGIGLALAVRLLPADRATTPARLDVVGLLLLCPGVVAMVYGLSEVASHGGFGSAGVLVPLVTGVALVVSFTGWALRAGDRALVDVRLFAHRALTSSTVLLTLAGISMYGAMLLLPLYYQQVRGTDALGAGLMMIPQGIGALSTRSLAGRLTDAVGGRWVAFAGFAIVTIATVPFALAAPGTSETLLGAALLVRGLGLGLAFIPLMTGAFVGLEHREMPHASVITRVAQQLGGSLGVAVLAVVLARAGAGSGSLAGLAASFDVAFWWAVGLTALAVPLSLLLPTRATVASRGR